MRTRTSRRGQPLVMLMLLVGGWVGARVVVWNTGPEQAGIERSAPVAADLKHGTLRTVAPSAAFPRMVTPIEPPVPFDPPLAPPKIRSLPTLLIHPAARLAPDQQTLPPAEPVPVPIAVGHQVLWMEALAKPPSPSEVGKPVSIDPSKPAKIPQGRVRDDTAPGSDPAPTDSSEF